MKLFEDMILEIIPQRMNHLINELMHDGVGCRTALATRGLLINYEDVFRTAPATLGVFNKDMKKNGQNNCQRVQKANRKEAFS